MPPELLRYLPISWREWVLPPLLLVVSACVVLFFARGHSGTPHGERLDLGWRGAATAAIVAAAPLAVFGGRAAAELTQVSAVRYRRAAGVTVVGLGAAILIIGVLTANQLLAGAGAYFFAPLGVLAWHATLRVAERDPHRARRVALSALVVAVAVFIGAICLAAFSSAGGFAVTFLVSHSLVFGAVTIASAIAMLRRLRRLRRGLRGPA